MPADDYGFWDDDRNRSHTGPIPRMSRQARPAVAPAAHRRDEVVVSPRTPRREGPRRTSDPFARRIGVLLAVGVVAAPIALMVRGDDTEQRLQAAPAAIVVEQSVAETLVDGPADVATQVAPIEGSNSVALAVAPESTVSVAPPVVATDAPVPSVVVVETTAATAPTTIADAAPDATTAAPLDVESVATTAPRAALAVDAVSTKIVTCASPYKVAAGDYWIRVARKFSVKLAALLSINKATVKTPLYPGRTICLPADATPPASTSATSPTATDAPSTTVKPKNQVKVTATTAPPTTAAPTTAAPTTTTTPPPKNTYSRAQVEAIIRAVWPDDLEEEALRIATRESNLIPTVRNSCCYGLFQIYFTANRSSLAASGITSAAQLYDPQVNAYAAYAMYLRAGGWGPWKL